jgi:hypothetical protein
MELLSNIMDEAFDTKTTMDFLLEVRSSSLEKLGKEDVITVMTNFPVEMVRILFNGLIDIGMDIDPKRIKDFTDKFAKATREPFSSNKNPWFDTHNENKFEFTDMNAPDYPSQAGVPKKGAKVKLAIEIEGTEARWSVDAHYLRSVDMRDSKPIELKNLSAEGFAKDLANKIKHLIDKLDPNYDISKKELESAKKGLVKEDPPIVKRLKPLCRIYLLDIYGKKDRDMHNIDLIEMIPSFTKFGIGWPEEDNPIPWESINKEWDAWSHHNKFRHFTYSFQTELLIEAIPIIFKRLKENNMLVVKGYLTDDAMAMFVSDVEPSANYPGRGANKEKEIAKVSYDMAHEAYKSQLLAQAEALNKNATKMTLNEWKHFIIINAMDPSVKKTEKDKK